MASSATVLFSMFQTLFRPQRSFEDRLREASQRMVDATELDFGHLLPDDRRRFEALNERLRAISNRVLADFPGVEGGFYVNGDIDRFAGYGFPTDQPGLPPPDISPPHPKLKFPPQGKKAGPRLGRGDEPPPKERPFIHVQAQNSTLLEPGDYHFDVRTVGPSRVAILTAPVGPDRPAWLVTWTMYRLASPRSQESQLLRYQVATGLALGGIALAVALMLNVGRTLKRQWIEQDSLRDELRRSEHLAALGTLLAGVAHEVRNPLAGIRSTVQLWERLPDLARSPDSIRAVVQAVDRLNEVISRLLYFTQVEHAERESVSVNTVVKETLNMLAARPASQAVTIECKFDPNSPRVFASADCLRQVFLDLVNNALQAMPQGGWLCCSTCHQPGSRRVEICFRDSGPGIPPEVGKHLFEPFFTTRADRTGLGLALCREVVLQHGGQIELEVGGPGTTIRILLPTTG
jgi:signal transduction histidine kinase